MKVTEQTTLAELQAYLSTLRWPTLTVGAMSRTPIAPPSRYEANVFSPEFGEFEGLGNTHAEAIEAALAALRNSSRTYLVMKCHGCGHTRDEHPNDSGCQHWHGADLDCDQELLPNEWSHADSREVVFAEEVHGAKGRYLVTLICGHKLYTAEKRSHYACKDCKKP